MTPSGETTSRNQAENRDLDTDVQNDPPGALPAQVQIGDGPSHGRRVWGVSLEDGPWLEWFAGVDFTFELFAHRHDRPADERLLSADTGVRLCPCNDVHHPLLQLFRDREQVVDGPRTRCAPLFSGLPVYVAQSIAREMWGRRILSPEADPSGS